MAVNFRVLYDGKYFVEDIVKSAQWSGDVAQPHRTLTLALSNTINGTDQAMRFELGKELRFYVENGGLFRGVIFSYSVAQDGNATVTAYDENVYLTKNEDSRRFVGMTAAGIIKEIAKAHAIPVGTIAGTGYVIPKLILRDMTLWDMAVTALTETRKQNGRKFFLYASEGKLNLREKKDGTVRWLLEDGVNIITANRSRSIEEMRTSVKVLGGDEEKKPLSASAKDVALTSKYGLMQHVERADSRLNQSQIQQLAKQRLKELGKVTEEVTVEALGNTNVIAGAAVYAFESMTELVGGFYVNADTHTFENGVHRMSVTLSKTDDLPKLEYEDPDAFEAAKKAKVAAKKKAKKTKEKAKKTTTKKKPSTTKK
ncbi:XkdQ/YqbQ family protein [Paenibacillus sp. SN-8-1]|uniref:XkdQ/YqbQ family protein n=1 Tax=Paenibacillus sp. SN-8-1 TaxID=3435409 RepID=UPI003D9A6537